MSLPADVARVVAGALGAPVGRGEAVHGGSINEAAAVDVGGERVFVKWHRRAPAGFFAAEADGLGRLAATGAVATPKVLACVEDEALSVLALAYHLPGRRSPGALAAAGRALARLHAVRGGPPGLARDNFIGSLPQDNRPASSSAWIAFFRERRLAPLADALPPSVRGRLDALDLEALLTEPEGGPALLHGDLWAGNLLATDAGDAVFIDPAVYRGHPEVDLAMTRLFGGFGHVFEAAYFEVAGRPDGDLDARLEVLNLYPLLVHARLFGGSYVREVDAVLSRYSRR